MNLGFLASGRGSNFQAVVDACKAGRIKAKPSLLISNNSKAYVLERARNSNVATLHLSSVTHPDDEVRDRVMRDAFRQRDIEVIVLVGYMKKLGPQTLAAYKNRIVNVHPALLPKFGGQGMYGMRVHEAVVANGETESGATVHLVDGEYDTGATLAQAKVPVLPGDSAEDLATRVLVKEHELLVDTLARIAAGELELPTK